MRSRTRRKTCEQLEQVNHLIDYIVVSSDPLVCFAYMLSTFSTWFTMNHRFEMSYDVTIGRSRRRIFSSMRMDR